MDWAYGMGIGGVSPAGNKINPVASNREGAWIKAFELALRMRNLENIVNRAPLSDICKDSCSNNVEQLTNDSSGLPAANERPIKAFMSAFRNLSGGDDKEGGTDLFAQTFRLTELSPPPITPTPNELNGILIPSSGVTVQKYYLDLWAYPLNLVTFFISFSSAAGTFRPGGGAEVPTAAGCAAVRMGLPVPGFIFGFSKNPNFLTYYAVKGSANYMGLLFPFTGNGIPLNAYAAAKPFGGRIGPKLFNTPSRSAVEARGQTTRSAAYLAGLKINHVDLTTPVTPPTPPSPPYWKRNVIPDNPQFWLSNQTDAIGGAPGSGVQEKFAVPNLLYDYIGDMSRHNPSGRSDNFTIIDPSPFSSHPNPRIPLIADTKEGLYNKDQFVAFVMRAFPGGTQAVLNPTDVYNAIDNIRSPTCYEALNYLIPHQNNDSQRLDSVGIAPLDPSGNLSSSGTPGNPGNPVAYKLFAPLVNNHNIILYKDVQAIKNVLNEYINHNDGAINRYMQGLNDSANGIRSIPQQPGRPPIDYNGAADKIHNNDSGNVNSPPIDCTKLSFAAKFNHFFRGSGAAPCGSDFETEPLKDAFAGYLGQKSSDPNFYTYFQSTYLGPPGNTPSYEHCHLNNRKLMTAYAPGSRHGANPNNGEALHPFHHSIPGRDIPIASPRNHYSTKFIPISSLASGGNYDTRPNYQEKTTLNDQPRGLTTSNFDSNQLNPSAILQEFSNSTYNDLDH